MRSRRNFLKGSLALAASGLWLPKAYAQVSLGLRDTAFMAMIGAQIPLTNLKFWFDANIIPGNDGDAIATWRDRSGNGNDATQGTGANQPILKKNIVNGNAVVRFNAGGGTTRSFVLPNAMGTPTTAEMFVVARADADPSAAGTVLGAWELSGNAGSVAWPFTDSTIYETFGSKFANHQAIANPVGNLASAFKVYNVQSEFNNYPIRLNGQLIHAGTTNVVGFAGATRALGTDSVANIWRGDIAEVIVYSSALSIADREEVHNYLAAKYGIIITNPSTALAPSGIAGLSAWWKVDDLVLNDGDPVSSWSDASGNGNTITNTLLLRPTFKTGVLNGKNAVRFTSTQSLAMAADLSIAVNTPFTVISVGQYTQDCSVLGHGANNIQFRVRRGAINQISEFINSGSEAISQTFTTGIGDATANLWRRTGTTTAGNMFQNGIKQTTGNIVNGAATAVRSLGAGAAGIPLVGDVSEVCIWNAVSITDVQWNTLYETYFRTRWGLP